MGTKYTFTSPEGFADELMPKVGRPPIGDRAMTAAERKARSRANALGELVANLELAAAECADWRRCMERGRPGATERDIEAAFCDIGLLIAKALLAVPRS